jgi:hypothetical protein
LIEWMGSGADSKPVIAAVLEDRRDRASFVADWQKQIAEQRERERIQAEEDWAVRPDHGHQAATTSAASSRPWMAMRATKREEPLCTANASPRIDGNSAGSIACAFGCASSGTSGVGLDDADAEQAAQPRLFVGDALDARPRQRLLARRQQAETALQHVAAQRQREAVELHEIAEHRRQHAEQHDDRQHW